MMKKRLSLQVYNRDTTMLKDAVRSVAIRSSTSCLKKKFMQPCNQVSIVQLRLRGDLSFLQSYSSALRTAKGNRGIETAAVLFCQYDAESSDRYRRVPLLIYSIDRKIDFRSNWIQQRDTRNMQAHIEAAREGFNYTLKPSSLKHCL